MLYTLQLYHAGIAIPSVSESQNTSETKKGIKKILVVDDEPDVSVTIKIGLEDTGVFEVYAYTDPEKVLRDFQPNFYDFVLIDIKMPKMNGYELSDKIREIDRKVKGCFITALEINYDVITYFYSLLLACNKMWVNNSTLIYIMY